MNGADPAISVWELSADGSGFRELTDEVSVGALLESGRRIWIDIDGTRESPGSRLERVVADIPALEGFKPGVAGGGENPPRLPPKAKAFADWIFGRFYWLHEQEDLARTVLQEIHLIVGRTFAITVRHPCLAWPPLERVVYEGGQRLEQIEDPQEIDLDALRHEVVRFVTDTSEPADRFGLQFAAVFLNKAVDSFFDTLDSLRGIAEDLELKVLRKENWLWKPAMARRLDAEMVGLRRILRQVRWAFMPADEVGDFRAGPFLEHREFDRRVEFQFTDLDRETERALATVKDVTEQVDHIVATRDSLKTDRLNRTLYVLTVVATVLLVPTLIAGIYGMNFEHMPELRWRFGYLGSILAMVLSGGGLWLGIRAYLRRGGRDLE